LTDFRKKKNI